MQPTYKNGANLLTFHYPQFQNFLHRGDVVIFISPLQPHPTPVMRIVGVGGDKMMLEGGKVYINSSILNEDAYLSQSTVTNGEPFLDDGEPKVVPSDAVFLMGDNRQFSADSRTWGFVPKDNITGLVLFCLSKCK